MSRRFVFIVLDIAQTQELVVFSRMLKTCQDKAIVTGDISNAI